MTAMDIDESTFPLVVVTFRGALTAESIERYFARVDVWGSRNTRVALVLDVTRLDVPSASIRRAYAAATAARGPAIARGCAGVAIVVTSTLIRGVVTAIGWVNPPPYPQKEVATMPEARVWCEEWLRAPALTSAFK